MAETIISNLSQVKKYITQNSFVVAYLDYKTLFGKFENGEFVFFNSEQIDIKFIKKVRIFNKDNEFYLWKNGNELCGRIRNDKQFEYEESIQLLFGSSVDNFDEDWCQINEKSHGAQFIFPGNFKINDGENKVALKVHNYIGYTENNLATYVDSRFVEFVQLPLEGGCDE